ncbi:MAG: histidine phosphatase family protein [Treponema sp.]|nr:histidine phosphatase family protein [Treponema sp.]
MKIYLVRHGETDWNRKLKIQGQADIPLNDTGRKQASHAAGVLSSIQADIAYTSPLQRARETAEIILSGKQCSLYTEPLLKEISYGIREGQSLTAVRCCPLFRLHNYLVHPGKYIPPRGGETISELKARCQSFLDNYVYGFEDTVSIMMIFTHGAFMRAMFSLLKRTPDEDFWSGPAPGNCGIIVMELNKGKFINFSYNNNLADVYCKNRLH